MFAALVLLAWPLTSLLTYGTLYDRLVDNAWLVGPIYLLLLAIWAGATVWLLRAPDSAIARLKLAQLPPRLRWPVALVLVAVTALFMVLSAQSLLLSIYLSLVVSLLCAVLAVALLISSGDSRPDKLLWLLCTVLVVYGAGVAQRAVDVNEYMGNIVETSGDQHEYERLAVNLAYGHGFSQAIVEPLATYHLETAWPVGRELVERYGNGARDPVAQPVFYRAPGWPMLLALVYRIVGVEPLAGRLLAAALAWGTAVLLLLSGRALAGWVGTLAGGLAGVLFMHQHVLEPNFMSEDFMTEPAASFWATLVAFLMVLYSRRPRRALLLALGAALLALVFTRSNFALVAPPLFAYVYFRGKRAGQVDWHGIWSAAAIIALPFIAWAAYASIASGQFVPFTTQNALAFPQYNNEQVLEGLGPEHLGQGTWQPGSTFRDGEWVFDWRYEPKAGQNGWVMGLSFWRDNFSQLPRLFYLKLRAGLWMPLLEIGRLYVVAIAFTLLGLGFRRSKPGSRRLSAGAARGILALQVTLCAGAVLTWGPSLFWLTLVLYVALALIALLRPVGDVLRPSFEPPTWYLAFIGVHVFVTLVYGGLERFHQPLDPFMALLAIFGLLFLVSLSYRLFANRTEPTLQIFTAGI
ncbi:MAG: hypothetical protein ACJ78Q_17780 [Chloroflexia bacterium]